MSGRRTVKPPCSASGMSSTLTIEGSPGITGPPYHEGQRPPNGSRSLSQASWHSAPAVLADSLPSCYALPAMSNDGSIIGADSPATDANPARTPSHDGGPTSAVK